MLGSLSHAELWVSQSVVIDQIQTLVAQQQVVIARLEARVRDLERELVQRDRDDPTKRMPGLKSAATPRQRKGGPRKGRPPGFSRVLAAPTEQVVHAVEACPRCATPLEGGWVAWRNAAQCWRPRGRRCG